MHDERGQTGTAAATARKILAVAERAASRPVLMAAFDAGELSLDQMALAVKAAAYTDAEMCGFARNATVTQLSTSPGPTRSSRSRTGPSTR